MEIEFANELLALIETARAAETKFPVGVIRDARQRLSLIRAAPDLQTLQNWKSLGLARVAGTPDDYALSLMPRWKMKMRLDDRSGQIRAVVISLHEHVQGAA